MMAANTDGTIMSSIVVLTDSCIKKARPKKFIRMATGTAINQRINFSGEVRSSFEIPYSAILENANDGIDIKNATIQKIIKNPAFSISASPGYFRYASPKKRNG